MTAQDKTGGAAFPVPGMTLRDYFAAAALPAACAFAQQYEPRTPDLVIARAAYKMADAMLAARTEEI